MRFEALGRESAARLAMAALASGRGAAAGRGHPAIQAGRRYRRELGSL